MNTTDTCELGDMLSGFQFETCNQNMCEQLGNVLCSLSLVTICQCLGLSMPNSPLAYNYNSHVVTRKTSQQQLSLRSHLGYFPLAAFSYTSPL